MKQLTQREKKYLKENDFTIKKSHHGLSKLEVSILKKTMGNRKIAIKQGIVFAPAFLISFILFILYVYYPQQFIYYGLKYSLKVGKILLFSAGGLCFIHFSYMMIQDIKGAYKKWKK